MIFHILNTYLIVKWVIHKIYGMIHLYVGGFEGMNFYIVCQEEVI